LNTHKLAESRSLAAHRLIAQRIPGDPSICVRARAHLERNLARDITHAFYLEQWRALLAGPVEQLVHALCEESEAATALRQTSPFAGILTARERWALWKTVRAEYARSVEHTP
jgi:hypothetical protein